MTRRTRAPVTPPVDYLRRTRELPVNLLFLVPWVVLYECCLLASQSPVENAAAAWLRALYRALGPRTVLLVGLLISLGLLLAVLLRIREATRDRGVYGGMILEGLVYGTVLGAVASLLSAYLPMGRMVALAAPMETLRDQTMNLGLAIGAGVFEELAFRGVLLTAVWLVLRHVVGADRLTAGGVAILLSAWVFSDYHHWGAGGEPFDARVFAFRFHAGIVLGTIFLTRGLGIAAFAHGFYDVIVMCSR